MSDVSNIVARAIQNDENNNFEMILIDVAKAFANHGFFQRENWREILNENFHPNVCENKNKEVNNHETQLTGTDVSMEATKTSTPNNQVSKELQQLQEIITPALPARKSQSGEINLFIDSSVRSLPLSLLYSHTSTPISAVKNTERENQNKVRQSCSVSVKAKNVQLNHNLANLRGGNWRKTVLDANVKQSQIQFVTSFKDYKPQIDCQKYSVKIVAKPIQRNVTVQNSSEIIETGADQKLNEKVLQAPVMPGLTDLSVVASCSTSNNVPENACDNSDKRNRISTFPSDDDSEDDNLLIPLKVRTPSPIKSISNNENIKTEPKVENEMDADVESTKNNEIRRVHTLDWAQMCSGQAQCNALVQHKDIQIMTHVHCALVVDDNMDHGSELRVAKKTTNNQRKRKLSEVATDSTLSSAGATRSKPNPPMQPISSSNLDDNGVLQSNKPVLNNIIITRRMTRLQSRLLASGMHPMLPDPVSDTVNSVRTNQRTKARKSTGKMSNASTTRSNLRVMFTIVNSEPFALLLEKLHITRAASNTVFDVLVTNRICRSTKFMIALGSGKPIVSTEWLNAMQKSNSILDPFDYILNDESGEKKYQFSLANTIKTASNEKLFKHCSILVTPNTSPDREQLKAVIVNTGGKYLKTTLKPRRGDRIICVSDVKDKKMWPTLLKKYPSLSDIIHVDGFARAILTHSLDVKDYSLQN